MAINLGQLTTVFNEDRSGFTLARPWIMEEDLEDLTLAWAAQKFTWTRVCRLNRQWPVSLSLLILEVPSTDDVSVKL